MGKLITSKQWTHGCYVKTPDKYVMVVKEKAVTIDEDTREVVSVKNRLTFDDPSLVNPKRTIYVTKPERRNHKYKKETEERKNVDLYHVEDRRLIDELKAILRIPQWQRAKLRTLCNSPYVYNADVSMEALVRMKYNQTKKHPITHFTVGGLDIETSMLGDGQTIVISYVHENTIFTAVLDEFMYHLVDGKRKRARRDDIYVQIRSLLGHMPDQNHVVVTTKDKKGNDVEHIYELHLEILEKEQDMILWIFDKLHINETDFVGIWNIDYDIPQLIKRLEYYGIDPVEVFSHPSVPKGLRYMRYHQDKKKTQHIADKWHWLHSTSMTQFVDMMLLYARIRKAKRKKSSYKLDAIAKEELGFGKLSIGDDDDDRPMDHPKMQREQFPAYVAYNIQDVILLSLMEKKNHDIVAMWNLTGDSPLSDFSKQSVMLKNGYYKFALDNGRVFATTGEDMTGPFDHLLGKVGGAVLRADLCKDIGTNCIAERPDLETMILVFASDLDYKAIYPSFKSGYGISKETKLSTTVEIEDVRTGGKKNVHDIEALYGGLANPKENSVWIGHDFFGLPNYEEMAMLVENALTKKL